MAAPHKPLLPVSPRMLAGLLAVIALIAWLLLPSKRDLLERQLRDGQSQKALVTLQGMSARERRKDPEFYALTELRLRRELLNVKNPVIVRQQITAACAAAERFKFKAEFNREFLALLHLVPAAGDTREILAPILPRMPLPLRRSVYDVLVAKALAASDPALAAQVFTEFWNSAPADESATAEMIRLWRGAGRPANALAALDAFAKASGGNLARTAPALARARVGLLRELGQPGKAFEAAWELAKSGNAATRREIFDLLVATARESGRGAEVLAEVRRNAESAPTDENAWRLLAELAVAAGSGEDALAALRRLVELKPEERLYHFKLAQLAEWNAQPELAFDEYRLALKLGEPAAIGRLMALNPGLYRDADLAAALAAAGELLDYGRHGLFLAQLHTAVGNYDEAVRAYERLLRAPGAGLAVLKEYGRLLLDLQDYDRAFLVFRRAAEVDARDLPTRRALAEIHFRLGHFEESFSRYRQLLAAEPDADTLENFIAIAESLGRTREIVAALRRSVSVGVGASSLMYQRLAHFEGMLGDDAAVGETLREGLVRFPQDHALRVQLVYLLVQEQQLAQAVLMLSQHPELRRNADVVQLYVDLLAQSGRVAEAEQFLASGIDTAILESPGVQAIRARLKQARAGVDNAAAPGATTLADVARLYRDDPGNPTNAAAYALLLVDAGRAKEAERVLRPFLAEPTPAVLQAAAFTYSALGNYTRAEGYQRRYLATQPPERAQALGYLGDILFARGWKMTARRVYQESLAEFFHPSAGKYQP